MALTAIEADQSGMFVQLLDQANKTLIAFSDRGWMDFIELPD